MKTETKEWIFAILQVAAIVLIMAYVYSIIWWEGCEACGCQICMGGLNMRLHNGKKWAKRWEAFK